MNWLAAALIAQSLLFGGVASDQFAKREYLDPEEDRLDQLSRGAFGLFAIAGAFAAGLLL